MKTGPKSIKIISFLSSLDYLTRLLLLSFQQARPCHHSCVVLCSMADVKVLLSFATRTCNRN